MTKTIKFGSSPSPTGVSRLCYYRKNIKYIEGSGFPSKIVAVVSSGVVIQYGCIYGVVTPPYQIPVQSLVSTLAISMEIYYEHQ
jgi:hypothetical protein